MSGRGGRGRGRGGRGSRGKRRAGDNIRHGQRATEEANSKEGDSSPDHADTQPHSVSDADTTPPVSNAESGEELGQQLESQEDDVVVEEKVKKSTTSTKSTKSSKNDWSIKNPKVEEDLIDWYRDNSYMWLITHKDYMNHIKKNQALEDKAKELGLTAHHINSWWKGMRDTFTRLQKKKSGQDLTDLPFKQRWIMDKLDFLRQRPITVRAPVVSVAALVEQHPGDLEAVEVEAAEEAKSQIAASTRRKTKSEEAEFQEALLKSLEDSRGNIASIMKSATSEDYLAQWGKTVVSAARKMSKKRERAFRKDVNALLHQYSPTTSEDENLSPPRKSLPSNASGSRNFGSQATMHMSSPPPFDQMGISSSQSSSGDGFWQPHPKSWIPNPPQASVYNSANPAYMRQYLSRNVHHQPNRTQMTPVQAPRYPSAPSSAGSAAGPSVNILAEAAAAANITRNAGGLQI